MKSPLKFILSAIGLVIVGWFIGDALPSQRSADNSSTPQSTATKSAIAPRSATPTSPRNSASQHMAFISSLASDTERTRAALRLAETLPLSQVRTWLENGLFDHRDGYAFIAFREALLRRWQEEAPDDYRLWTLQNDENIPAEELAQFATEEPELFSFFMEGLPNEEVVRNLTELSAENPEAAWEFFMEARRKGRILADEQEFLASLARNHPEMAESLRNEIPLQHRDFVDSILLPGKLREDLSGTLAKLQNKPGGFQQMSRILETVDEIPDKFLAEVENFPSAWKKEFAQNLYYIRPENAADLEKWLAYDWEAWDAEFSSESKSSLYKLLLRNHRTHIEIATEHMDRLEADERTEFLSSLVYSQHSLSENRKHLLSLLPTQEDRNYLIKRWEEGGVPNNSGYRTIVESSEILSRVETIAQSSGPERTKQMTELDNASVLLSPSERENLTNAFSEAQGNAKNQLALYLAQRGANFGDEHQQAGMRYLAGNEEGLEQTGFSADEFSQLTSRYTVELLTKNAPAAAEFTNSLPPGETRDWTTRNLYQNWRKLDSSAAAEWLRAQPPELQADLEAK